MKTARASSGSPITPASTRFPMFSSDGKKLVWASNRNGRAPHETKYFHRGLGELEAL